MTKSTKRLFSFEFKPAVVQRYLAGEAKHPDRRGGGRSRWALSEMLVTVLAGVFDPPPAALAVPGPCLALLLLVSTGSILAVDLLAFQRERRPAVEVLRDLQ